MILSLIFIKESEDLVEFNLLIIGFVGLIFGSFLNMLIYRLPLGISLFNPKRSVCPNCNYQIKWYENLPIISYIYLKGKCSNCKSKISIIYPIVEILTAVVTITIFFKTGFNLQFLFILSLFYSLIVLSFIDFEFKAVPDYLLIISLLIAIVYIINYKFENIVTLFIFAGGIVLLELFVTYYIQNIKAKIVKDDSLKTQKSVGEGDIPIIAIIGGILGVQLGIMAIFLSAIFAIIPSLINIFIKKEIETPFIPFLTMGLFVVYINDIYFLELLQGILK
ncbi:MAG: prepilin peptidase [Campylobacterota bacterium]|nr:prepilin peptidase [Campylobacterota bacterium]